MSIARAWDSQRANMYRHSTALECALCIVLHKEMVEVAVEFDDGVVSSRSAKMSCRVRWSPLAGSCTHIPLPPHELGSTEIYTDVTVHSPNGRFVSTVLGDGEYALDEFGNSFAWTRIPMHLPCRKTN